MQAKIGENFNLCYRYKWLRNLRKVPILKYIPKHCCWQSFFMLDLMVGFHNSNVICTNTESFRENCINRNTLTHIYKHLKRHATHPNTKWWTLQRPNVETRNWESNFPQSYFNYGHICDPRMQNATIDLKASKNRVWHTNAVSRVINFKLATIIWIWFQLLDKRLVVIVRQPNTTNMPKKHSTHILAKH